jgi:hypothetical protein
MTHSIGNNNDSSNSNSYSENTTLLDKCRTLAVVSLGFWISTSLLIDIVVMPTLWATGMMETSGFASAGYSLFWVFNRFEVICAAAAFSSILGLGTIVGVASSRNETRSVRNENRHSVYGSAQMRVGALMLLIVSLSYTFILTPYMSGLAMNMDVFAIAKSIPAEMNQTHSIYWVLEASKLGIASMLLAWCNRTDSAI